LRGSPTVVDIDPAIRNRLHAQLVDFGSLRPDAMDRAGIERSVLSLAGPGVQREPIRRCGPLTAARAEA
jgi:2,3-dihydroxybenzoate decarboxylase